MNEPSLLSLSACLLSLNITISNFIHSTKGHILYMADYCSVAYLQQCTLQLLPFPTHCKQCCNEHWRVDVLATSDIFLLAIHPMSTRPPGDSIFNFLRKLHTMFYNSYTDLCSCQQCVKLFFQLASTLLTQGLSLYFSTSAFISCQTITELSPPTHLVICCYVVFLKHSFHDRHSPCSLAFHANISSSQVSVLDIRFYFIYKNSVLFITISSIQSMTMHTIGSHYLLNK